LNKNLGIVAHLSLNNEDRIDRSRFLDVANDYYYLKKKINSIYNRQLALVFESPVVISNIFSWLERDEETTDNKR
jgi:hypothetical protein